MLPDTFYGKEKFYFILFIRLKVEKNLFTKSGDLKIKCTATIDPIYWKSNEESIQGFQERSYINFWNSGIVNNPQDEITFHLNWLTISFSAPYSSNSPTISISIMSLIMSTMFGPLVRNSWEPGRTLDFLFLWYFDEGWNTKCQYKKEETLGRNIIPKILNKWSRMFIYVRDRSSKKNEAQNY